MTKATWGNYGDFGNCPNCKAEGTFGAESERWIYPLQRPFQETNIMAWLEKSKNWRCWSCKEES